ncbi:preprotein translocase subunit YajC [Actinacidiphila rubida]|uniref:preprotein translocase subunit YajC n=1 Tax=Actinacidiphila rubida TaxID=310780 RepID=UPI000849AED6|nr:preprotein translocase subunit YajC [Actinacidiphila rubida]
MNIGILLPLILIVGVMFMMSRSAKNKQRQASEMRSKMEPGTGVRTIGGMYAVVKEVNDETVLLELTDGVHVHFAKNAIAVVLGEDEFNRIVHGIEPEGVEHDGDDTLTAGDGADDADEAKAGTEDAKVEAEDAPIDLSKSEAPADAAPEQNGSAARDAK